MPPANTNTTNPPPNYNDAQGANTPVTMAQVQQLLNQTNTRIAQFEGENERLWHSTNRAKLEAPSKYNGNRDELTGWLVQIKAYLIYYVDRFPNEAAKVAFAAQRLEGEALQWFGPTLKDFFGEPRPTRSRRLHPARVSAL
jgi:hypothetical protein